jgi:hypothetical protein
MIAVAALAAALLIGLGLSGWAARPLAAGTEGAGPTVTVDLPRATPARLTLAWRMAGGG